MFPNQSRDRQGAESVKLGISVITEVDQGRRWPLSPLIGNMQLPCLFPGHAPSLILCGQRETIIHGTLLPGERVTTDELHPLCPKCSHILRGITEPRCPECGWKISAEDFADLSRLIPGPPWERRRERGRIRCFFATIYQVLIHPRRFFRILNGPATVHGAILYWMWLVPAAFAFLIALYAPVYVFDAWEGSARMPEMGCVLIIRYISFVATGVIVNVPILVALDLLLWRRRAAFHVLARGILYSMTWWCATAALFAGLGNWFIDYVIWHSRWRNWFYEYFWYGWGWGEPPFYGVFSGGSPEENVPWMCWVAAAVSSFQYLAVFLLIKRASAGPVSVATRLRLTMISGWILSIYLLCFDNYVHLRIHLQFCVSELDSFTRSIGQYVYEVFD